ncbi:Pro-Pol polyprotein [Anthophora plagiata]
MERASCSRDGDERASNAMESRLDRLENMMEEFMRRSRVRSHTTRRHDSSSRSRSRSPEKRSSRVRSRSPRKESALSQPRESRNNVLSDHAQRARESISSRNSSSRAKSPCYVRPGDEQLIPMYDPSKEDVAIENWVRHVDDLAARFSWDDLCVMRLIASRLKGHARQWYDTRMQVATTWAETKVLLVAQFRRTMPFSRLLREADLYEAKPGQSLGDYCFQKLNLIRRLNIGLSDEKTIDMVVYGIPDEPLARTIRSAKHTDPNDLYAYMCTMGHMPGKEKRKETEARTIVQKTTEKSRGKGFSCFNCGKIGHVARECRKTKAQCGLCKKLGHRQENCRQKEVNIIRNPIRNSTLNIYQIYIRINGHKVESLIDTGSACTIVHSSVVKKFLINTKNVDDTTFRGFAGQSVVISQIATITVKVQNVAAKVDSFIIPDEYTAYDVILGRDFLQQDHVVMLKRGNRLTFNDARDAKRPQATSAMDICVVEENPLPNVGNIGEEARRLCIELLEEFRDCISTSMRDLGRTNTIAMEIKCLTDEPIVYRPYRLAESEKRVVREIIADLLANGIIRESESPYASPITLVKKKTGDVRMMAHVDALSRNPQPTPLEVFYVDITEAEWIVAAQMQDEQLSRIRTILANNDKSPEVKHYFKEYVLKKDKVYRRMSDNKIAWVVPRNARLQICRLCHDDAGHLSAEKTLQRIQRNYWFAGMRRFVDKYVRACLSCAYYKHTSGKKQCKLNTIKKVPIPFHTLHIDHVGPFETSRKGNKYLLVMVDAFTKFTIVEPVKDQKTRHTEKVLLNLMYLFGVPTRIISDRGTSFTSKRFATLCATYGIRHVLNAVATPRANGQVERYNKTIIDALATSAAGQDPRDWDTQVKKVQSAINTMHNKSIDTTPMQALIGCNTKTMAEGTILNAIREEMDRLDFQELREDISSHISKEQKRQKERYDRTRREARRYTVDELVLVQVTSDPSTGGSRKLLPKYKGPFRIRTILPNDRYEVEDLREGVKRLRTVVAADRIKPWIVIQGDDHDT